MRQGRENSMEEEATRVKDAEELALEEPEKPGILRIIVPFVGTALIFWWILSRINFTGLTKALVEADLAVAISVMALHSLVFFASDTVAFGYAYKWFLTRKVPWKDVAILRGGMYLLQVALAPLAEIIPPAYFLRKHKVKVFPTLGSEMYVLFCDGYSNTTILILGLLLGGGGAVLGMGWVYFLIFHYTLLVLVFLYWRTPLKDKVRFLYRLRDAAIMKGFREAGFRHFFAFYGIRGVLAITNVLAGWALLDALHVQLPFHHLLLLVPVMMFSTFLPISTGGYGGPQGAAVLILVTLYGHTTTEIAVAFSLLWSTFFALGRATIGAVLAYPVWNLVQEKPEPQPEAEAP